MKNINKILILTASIVFASCSSVDDFLDKEPSSDQSYVSTIADCDLILNNPLLTGGVAHTIWLDDCIAFGDVTSLFEKDGVNYREYSYWSGDHVIYKAGEDDGGWNSLYKNIYYTNVVINKIDGVSGDDETLRSQLKGEAYMGRAFYHFMAVNLYAKQYNVSTAATDPGVPYVKDIDAQGKRSRATVQEVYDNVLEDLNMAIANLKTSKPVAGKNYRGNLAGANALLAKVYFYMQNWDKAIEYANKSLAIYSNVIDYNSYADYDAYEASDNYNSLKNEEATYLKGDIDQLNSTWHFASIDMGMFLGGLYLTPEVTDYIDIMSDLRYSLFMDLDFFSGNTTIVKAKQYDALFYGEINAGCSTVETYFILAESYARKGQTADACTALNNILSKRYDSSTFTNYTSSVAADVIEKITNERKVEFLYSGNRWFEMRRLNTLGEYNKTVLREDAGIEIGKLVASPARLTLPIPQKVTDINPEITQNPFE